MFADVLMNSITIMSAYAQPSAISHITLIIIIIIFIIISDERIACFSNRFSQRMCAWNQWKFLETKPQKQAHTKSNQNHSDKNQISFQSHLPFTFTTGRIVAVANGGNVDLFDLPPKII